MLRWLVLLAVCCLVGCARTRVVTISTVPADAMIRVDGRDRGRGPITETFTFAGDTDVHRVIARRAGYAEKVVAITPDFDRESIVIELKPVTRQLTFRVTPADATIKVDGEPVPTDAPGEATVELEFPVDPRTGRWATHTVSVEHPRFKSQERTLSFDEPKAVYEFNLESMRKDFKIVTTPPAEVFLNDQFRGTGEVTLDDFEFPVDPETRESVPLKLRVEKPGFATHEETIGWDDGKENYEVTLQPRTKTVRVITDPPDARVVIGGVEIPPDETGAHSYELKFPPINEQGDSHPYKCEVSKSVDGAEWKRKVFPINWDDGRTDYEVTLEEVLTRPVRMLRVVTDRGADGWTVSGETGTVIAMRDTGEGPGGAAKLRQVTRLPAGTVVEALAAAPDGSQVVFTTISADADGTLRSQILAQKTDGAGEATEPTPLTDGQALEVTPSFTPDGSQLVFASNRAGPMLSIWSMPATGDGGPPQQLTSGEAHDLWPSVDSNPKPRLFYQSLADDRPEPQLFSRPVDAPTPRRALLPGAGATQPRVGPKADALLFAAAPDGAKGNRDIFRVSDDGRSPVNLTNTPDADEFGPCWANDGRRVAFASNRERPKESPDNYDIYVMDATRPKSPPLRVTTNGSWDDCPAWDAGGRALYFRSNRGGEWNVWRIELN